VFTMEQFVACSIWAYFQVARQVQSGKIAVVNQQYLKHTDGARLAELAKPFHAARLLRSRHKRTGFVAVAELLRERVSTVEELADAAVYFYRALDPDPHVLEQHVPGIFCP